MSQTALPIPQASALRTLGLTAIAMVAFAGNSVLCRLALAQDSIDPASFTSVRMACGAATLWLILALGGRARERAGSWKGASALMAYAAAFSFAYTSLTAGTGALLLFGAVQATMIAAGLLTGERLAGIQWIGFLLALSGLAALVAPGVSAPPWQGAGLMLAAGMAWGCYSLLGRGAGDPLAATAGNFLRALPIALAISVLAAFSAHMTPLGFAYAALSGAVTSGIGYTIWYAALPGLSAGQGASVQLSVPVITALGGAFMLGEAPTLRLAACSVAILAGIALVIASRGRAKG